VKEMKAVAEIEVRKFSSDKEAIEAFINSQDVKEASKRTYNRQLKQFFKWLKDTNRMGESLNRDDILAYREYLINTGKTSLTVAGYLTAVRKFFEWSEAMKIYPNIAKVKSPRKPKGYRKDVLNKSQLRRSLDVINTDTLEGKRDYALFNLLARTGLRTIEVARAAIGDIRQEAGQAVLWIQGKGRDEKDDFVVLNEKTLQPIEDYLQEREKEAGRQLKDSEPLFISLSNKNKGEALTTRSISRIIKNVFIKAGINNSRITAHSLRHTAITLSIVGGASIQQAQAMARHGDIKTTMIYFHNLERIKAGAENYIDF
jgi:integrase/recombinase XerC/integrase/recombinase XerD